MTDIPLNTYIEWTDADRERGECPVPAGSDVTVWIAGGDTFHDAFPEERYWGQQGAGVYITGYLVHELAREPIVRWIVVGSNPDGVAYLCKRHAKGRANEYGGRVVKLVEVDDD